ncbi:hypothetical protein VNO78_35150 [Psophocarpus tetragonolobus]|uniref:Uncharacterized protein n=1 Tax=Psophocarpus tetragonolobus TaxID=3891 RepID=A0AAN9NS07_PSOTE
MPLPALQQPSQAEDPNGATFVLSMEGFFPHLSQGSPEVFLLERIVTDGEIRKRKYSPIAKKRRTRAMTLRSLRPVRTSISENIGLGYLPTPLPAPKTLSDAESSGDLSFRSLPIVYKLCLRQTKSKETRVSSRIGCRACAPYRGRGQVNGSRVDNPRPVFRSASFSNERDLTVHGSTQIIDVFAWSYAELD